MHTADSSKRRRKRCLNDNKLFTPARNVPDQKFCCDPCRKEFHHHGSAFGPMKLGLHRAIEKKYKALQKVIDARNRAVVIQFEEAFARIEKVAVEVSKLRAQIDLLRGQYEKHIHEYDRATTDEWYEASTGTPLY